MWWHPATTARWIWRLCRRVWIRPCAPRRSKRWAGRIVPRVRQGGGSDPRRAARIVEAMPDSLTKRRAVQAFEFEWDKEAPWYNHDAERMPSGKPWWGKSFDRELIGDALIKYVLQLALAAPEGEDDAAYDARANKLVNEPFTCGAQRSLRGAAGAIPTPERDLEVLVACCGWGGTPR